MDYQEYIRNLNRINYNLENELDYYRSMCVYIVYMLASFCDDYEDISFGVSEYFKDLIKDSEREKEIIELIIQKSEEIVDNYTSEYFEGNQEFNLYMRMFMRINNSSKKRAMDAFPVILMFHNLIKGRISQKSKYNTVKRHKHMNEHEYTSYLDVLKK